MFSQKYWFILQPRSEAGRASGREHSSHPKVRWQLRTHRLLQLAPAHQPHWSSPHQRQQEEVTSQTL